MITKQVYLANTNYVIYINAYIEPLNHPASLSEPTQSNSWALRFRKSIKGQNMYLIQYRPPLIAKRLLYITNTNRFMIDL